MTFSRRVCGLLVCYLLLALTVCVGAPVYGESAALTGSRTEGTHLITLDEWHDDALSQQISWAISPLGGGLWEYQYTFTYFASPSISHFILDLTDDCVPDNPGCVMDASGGELTFNDFGPHPSNPGFPVGYEIIGVKVDSPPSVFTFTSNRAPVYGDIYIKGGQGPALYNAGLINHESVFPEDFIARPNGTYEPQEPEVPEPATYAMLGVGLLALAGLKRRKP